MFRRVAGIAAAAVLGAVPAVASAQTAAAEQFHGDVVIPHVAAAPPLSGPLSGPWSQAAKIPIAFDAKTRRISGRPAIAYVESAGDDLYIAFDVVQTQPITAQQHQNDAGLGNDDVVIVYFYPNGPTGFEYAFAANPIGTHSAFSTENSAFAPTWQSNGRIGAGGYMVFMRIPLATMKGGRNGVWRANFRQFVSSTLDDYDWSYNSETVAGSDPQPVAAGTIRGIPVTQKARPKPRLQVYGLGAAAAPRAGGATSRAGLDASIPITETATLVSTIHPDYSNVEIDQSTISPTAFPRFYQDVRPFFTQLQNYYNPFACYSCTGVDPLYTTAIPTPRYGNAIEGKQGPLSFAAFDAVGAGRDDNAEVASYQSSNQKFNAGLQRVSVSLPGIRDDTALESAIYDSQKGFAAEALASQEQGSLVHAGDDASWTQAGIGTYDKTGSIYGSVQRIGSAYSPFDGYVANNGIAGYSVNSSKTWYRSSGSGVPRLLLYAETDRYWKPDGTLGQADNQLAFGADLQHMFGLSKLIHVRGQIGSSFLQLPDGVLVPVSQNGIELSYNYRTALADYVSYYTGRFGPGTLDYWTRQANLRVANAVTLSLEADDGTQRLDRGGSNQQWLERASIVWQRGRDESFSVGLRRIIGSPPVLEGSEMPNPYLNAWNVSAAFYKRWPYDELYVVYGDPSRLSTYPVFIVKFIHYVGAQKGV